MKIRDVIKEFVPCEVCGNSDVKSFYFHVVVDKDSQPYVKCCECEEEYYSTSAKSVLSKVEETMKLRNKLRITFSRATQIGFSDQGPLHPLVKVLAQM